jgi:transposase-like protein
VAKVQGDAASKRRVEVIFSTMPATRTVAEACRELDIGPTHFDNLRTQALQGATDRLSPRPIGRPRRVVSTSVDVEALQRENRELRRENALLRTQVEVAAALQDSHRPKSVARRRAARRTVP